MTDRAWPYLGEEPDSPRIPSPTEIRIFTNYGMVAYQWTWRLSARFSHNSNVSTFMYFMLSKLDKINAAFAPGSINLMKTRHLSFESSFI
jgi:hypothetical protein